MRPRGESRVERAGEVGQGAGAKSRQSGKNTVAVESVRQIYRGAKNPRTGERIFAGWPVGTETTWTTYFVGPAEPRRNEFWKLWVFNNPAWDWQTFDFDRLDRAADAPRDTGSAAQASRVVVNGTPYLIDVKALCSLRHCKTIANPGLSKEIFRF